MVHVGGCPSEVRELVNKAMNKGCKGNLWLSGRDFCQLGQFFFPPSVVSSSDHRT